MAIHITEAAAKKVKDMISKGDVPTTAGLRIGVKGGGCSGLSYVFDVETAEREGDKVFEEHGVKIYVDLKSYLFVNELTLDYHESLMHSGFKMDNPNARRTCGCGDSFAV